MAVVRSIQRGSDSHRLKLQPTEVEAVVRIFGAGDDGAILQVDTFGSASRELPGKLSQTLQFDRKAALELPRIIDETYGP